jgi:hypothetical protein
VLKCTVETQQHTVIIRIWLGRSTSYSYNSL